MGMEFRPYYFAREWIKMGHRVDIIAADYSHLRRVNPEVNKDFQEDIIDGIHYHWVKTGSYEGNGVKRAITMARFVSKLWIHAGEIINDIAPDVVICSSTYPLDTYVGQKIKRKSKKKVKLIHEVHDMWPLTLIEIGGMSKKHPFIICLQVAEDSAYRNSDKVVSLLPYAKEYMVEHGMREDKFVEIPNGVVTYDWKNPENLPEEHRTVLEHLKNEGKYIVGYFGGHALSNALNVLVECAEKIDDDEVHFVLVGDGVEKKHLMDIAKKKNLKNITFLDPISKKVIPNLCNYIDIIYMGGNESPLYRYGLCMNKMFDAFAAGKPIICAITAPETPIEKYKCGIVVKSLDVVGIINAIDEIKKENKDSLDMLRDRAQNLAKERYSYGILAKQFSNIFI